LRIYFRPGGEGKFAGVCDMATSRGFAPKSRHSFLPIGNPSLFV
jgi:hypothetical protein